MFVHDVSLFAFARRKWQIQKGALAFVFPPDSLLLIFIWKVFVFYLCFSINRFRDDFHLFSLALSLIGLQIKFCLYHCAKHQLFVNRPNIKIFEKRFFFCSNFHFIQKFNIYSNRKPIIKYFSYVSCTRKSIKQIIIISGILNF